MARSRRNAEQMRKLREYCLNVMPKELREAAANELNVQADRVMGLQKTLLAAQTNTRTGNLLKTFRKVSFYKLGKGGQAQTGKPAVAVEIRVGRTNKKSENAAEDLGVSGYQVSVTGGQAAKKGRESGFYARFLEFGTRHMMARPFFFPVYRAMKNRVKAAVRKASGQTVKRVSRKTKVNA